MPSCLILCGGANSRWNHHLGIERKHLIGVEGECLLQRTLGQVHAAGVARPTVVINRGDGAHYAGRLEGNFDFLEIDPRPIGATEAWKFLSSRSCWNATGPTIVLLGDVWFSAAAIESIFARQPSEWVAFGRAGASTFSGHPHGEIFAQRFERHERHLEQLQRLDELYRAGLCQRTAGWAHYHLMIGAKPSMQCAGKDFCQIDDFTEDFDSPADFEGWNAGRCRWRVRHGSEVEPAMRQPTPDFGRIGWQLAASR